VNKLQKKKRKAKSARRKLGRKKAQKAQMRKSGIGSTTKQQRHKRETEILKPENRLATFAPLRLFAFALKFFAAHPR